MGIYEGGMQQIGDAAPVKSIGRVKTGAVLTPSTGDLCDKAADALGRKSPAAPFLVAQCYPLRIREIAQGTYRTASVFSPNDPAYRVALTDAGDKIVRASPELTARRARMPLDGTDRGFTMAQGVRAGFVEPDFVAWVRAALSGPTLRAFDEAIAEPAGGAAQLTQAATPDSGGGPLSSIPRPVLIGGAAVAVLGLAALAYKFTR